MRLSRVEEPMVRKRLPSTRTPQQISEHRSLREQFQQQRPSLADLVNSGDVSEVVRQGEMLEIAHAGALLRAARQKAGLSLADVSARTGIDRAALSRLENGANSPTLTTLQRYADALGLQLRIGLTPVGS
jgi:ribosome-binding protein aMBF1 (putative translation factor)